jgi:3-dehydroquinate synthetase
MDSMQHLIGPAAAGDYPILIGRGLDPELMATLDPFAAPRLVVSDEFVQAARAETLAAIGDSAGCSRWILPPGEASKSPGMLMSLLEECRRLGLERGSALLAFGGGVVGDLTGLAAGLWLRGLPWIQAPTSLLAMVDASVGGKTGINFGGLKNSVGLVHAPAAVIADLEHLRTLPRAEWVGGFGELLKAAWLSDVSWAEALEAEPEALLDADSPQLEPAIARAVAVKIQHVAGDERDRGRRQLLNLGHSFAHALEAASGHAIGHGQAVLLGLVAALAASRDSGRWPSPGAGRRLERLAGLLARLGVRRPCLGLDGEEGAALLDRMRHDKKVSAGALRLVLPLPGGGAELATLGEDQVLRAWREVQERVPCASP